MFSSPLRGAHIVCFGTNPWHDIWRNRQHIFSRLARENTVLYVEPKVYGLAALRHGRVRRENLRSPRLQHEANGLWLYRHPVWAPRSPRPGLGPLTRRLRWLALRLAMARLGMRHPISWVFHPTKTDTELVGTLGERLVVYHVVDQYAAFRHLSPEMRRQTQEEERQLLARADLVIATSQRLQAAKASLNPHVVFVPNGVDFAAYGQVRQSNMPPPEDIARLGHPIVGYAGNISIRLDLPLLAEIARQRPGWSLALVGPDVPKTRNKAEMVALRALPNVHFLGKKASTEVPRYIDAFDACLIPYHPGEEADHINPIKLFEYLAAGKPVVSIDIPALDGFRHVIRTASSPDTFVAALETALNETEPTLVEERRRLAAENSWDHRVETIGATVRQALEAI